MADIKETIADIRSKLPLPYVCQDWYGMELSTVGRSRCPICKGRNKTKFRLTTDRMGWVCETCGKGDVIELIMKLEGLSSVGDAVTFIESKGVPSLASTSVKPAKRSSGINMKALVKEHEYVYHTEGGDEAYKIIRYWNKETERKECIPQHKGRNGLASNLRCLYNLNRLVNVTDETVFIVEGEKCADAMTSLGYIATTNPFGSGQWKEEFGYAKCFAEKDVVIMPDADEGGTKWLAAIFDDLRGKVAQIRVIKIPNEFVKEFPALSGHDIADYLERRGDRATKEFIDEGYDSAKRFERGYESKSFRPQDAYRSYKKMVKKGDFITLDFSEWIPSMDIQSRRGDLIGFIAGTGVGKGRTLMNLMYYIRSPLYLVFDLELSAETIGERWCAIHNSKSVKDVRLAIEREDEYEMPNLDHIRIVPCGGITMEFIKERIKAEEAILRKEIPIIIVDYLGLMKTEAKSGRYEGMSAIVESIKSLANELNKTFIITSQRSRPQDKEAGLYQCPSAFDAKDSGSIENSCQELFGLFRIDPATYSVNEERIGMRPLKYTHGRITDSMKAEFHTRDLRFVTLPTYGN